MIRSISALCFMLSLTAFGDYQLASNGASQCMIVHPEELSEPDQFAIKELREHLAKVTGAEFAVKTEKEVDEDDVCIFVGQTEFASRNGVEFSSFGSEEWQLLTVSDNLIITGGAPRGTLYGVYDFLENVVGCHWIAFDETVIPDKPNLRIPHLDIRKKPALAARNIYRAFHLRRHNAKSIKQSALFQARNRDNSRSGNICQARSKFWRVSLQHRKIYKKMGGAHTFHGYVPPEEHFENHPEYFPLSEQGVRFYKPMSQLCLSNPGVWDTTLTSLRTFIEADRSEFKDRQHALPYVYDISQMDGCTYICQCRECKALSAREGGEAGLVVNYLNRVATAIEKEYSDIMLRTFAYVSTDVPPKTLKVHDKVIIWFCDLYGRSDCYRPLTHPFNEKQFELLKGWTKIAKNVLVWDYWNMAATGVRSPVPEVLVDAIAEDFKTFRDLNLLGCFVEAEENYPNCQSFMEMQYFLGYQMMLDPDRPVEPLIDLFINNYYGEAASDMREYFDFLRKTVRNNPDPMFYTPPYHRAYLTGEFLLQCREHLQQAREKLAADDPIQVRLDREEVTVTLSIIEHFNQFKSSFDAAGLKRDKLLEEYQDLRKNMIDAWCSPAANELLQEEMEKLTFKLPLPDKFAHLEEDEVRDFAWLFFSGRARAGAVVEDKDSEAGKAYKLVGGAGKADFHSKDPVFGLYDKTTETWGETFKIKSVPQDEQYHWYRLKEFDFLPSTILWGHWTWWLGADLANVYISPDGLPASINRWTPWISVKFTGPSYVQGSEEEDAIYLDRVILTRPGAEVK